MIKHESSNRTTLLLDRDISIEDSKGDEMIWVDYNHHAMKGKYDVIHDQTKNEPNDYFQVIIRLPDSNEAEGKFLVVQVRGFDVPKLAISSKHSLDITSGAENWQIYQPQFRNPVNGQEFILEQ